MPGKGGAWVTRYEKRGCERKVKKIEKSKKNKTKKLQGQHTK
jgi:hypothetical protein